MATGRYAWPVSRGGQITSRFGQRGGSFHAESISAPPGTTGGGLDNRVVTYAGWNGGYGKCVIISHGGSSTLYGHLSQIMVKHGQTVQKGQTIGGGIHRQKQRAAPALRSARRRIAEEPTAVF